MRVLWITTHAPDPTIGGGASHEFELLRWAGSRHEVTVLCGRSSRVRPGGVPLPGIEVVEVPHRRRRPPGGKPGHYLAALRGGGISSFREVAELRTQLSERAVELVAEGSFDLVQVCWAELAPVTAATASTVATVAWVSDSFVRHTDREVAAADRWWRQVLARLERRNARRWEERWYGVADRLAASSPIDAEAMAAHVGRHVDLLPVVLGPEWGEGPSRTREADLVVFVGALDYGPNVDAIRWFCAEVWPLVRERSPERRLEVVGRSPGAEVVDAVAAAGGVLHADVPDVQAFYARAGVVVAPVRLGGGVRNKVLHALASRAPLVASPTAVEGTDVAHGRHALLAEDATSFADAIASTVPGPGVAERTEAAAALAEGYRIERVGPGMERWWEEAVAARRAAPVEEP